jgi:outer membrane protein assembly factor BamB
MACYTGARLARYDPGGAAATAITTVGDEQHRPRNSLYHPPTGSLFVGTRPMYGRLGGALAVLDAETDDLVEVRRGVVPDQSVTALAAVGDTLYLGTEIHGGMGVDPTTEAAAVAALDLHTREKRWETVPLPEAAGIGGLVPTPGADTLCGYSFEGVLFGFDPASRSVTFREQIAAGSGQLVALDGRVYGATADRLFCYDPASGEAGVVLDGLGGDWHSTPEPATDGTHLYVIRDREVLRVSPDA